MITLAARLDQYVRAQGLAITGVSIGDTADRATWRVHPSDLQAAAQPHIDAFVLPTADQLADEDADRDLTKAIRALGRECYDAIPNNPNKPATFADFMQRVKARYRALTS